MSRTLALAAVVLATGLSACMPGTRPSADRSVTAETRQCFLPQSLRNFRSESDARVYVRDTGGAVFEITSGGCRGLMQSQVVSITPEFGSTACVGQNVGLATAGPSLVGENNSVCRGRVERRLTLDEIAALPSRLRP